MRALLTYAVGDIHGSYDKLSNLLRHCKAHAGSGTARFVFLGDYVDRGANSRDVVNLLMQMQAACPDEVVCLKGNHEDMLLDAAARGDEELWLYNGGDSTLRSYGVREAAALPREHLAWFEQLPLALNDGRRLFVHAGIMPGVPLEQQSKEAMLWIRERFLLDPRDHGIFVVHGHTPTQDLMPELRPNRLALDTLAWHGGPLTAAVFDDSRTGPLAFIADNGRVTPAGGMAAGNNP